MPEHDQANLHKLRNIRRMTGKIIIGLGSGRSGTASLANLLDRQENSLCFHELNPSCVAHDETPRPILNTIEEFDTIVRGGDTSRLSVDLSRPPSVQQYSRLCDMPSVDIIGDVAHYYLQYVDAISALNTTTSFVCLRRDREETVQSWMKKTEIKRWRSRKISDRLTSLITRAPYYTSTHHWAEHDGSTYKQDPVWDKCFPNFVAASKEDAIRQYWDYYYKTAESLQEKYPNTFRIFEVATLNNSQGRREILEFCGIGNNARVEEDSWIHKS